VPVPDDGELDRIAAAVPPMTGAEYLTAACWRNFWRGTDAAFDVELAQAKLSVQEFFKRRHPAWKPSGRVSFQSRRETGRTRTRLLRFWRPIPRGLSGGGKGASTCPLGRALGEYSGAKNRERLLSLLCRSSAPRAMSQD